MNKPNKPTTWAEHKRPDLREIPIAIAAGFRVDFKDADKQRGTVTPQCTPMDCPRFIRDLPANLDWAERQQWIWHVRGGYQTAELIDGHFCKHSSKPLKPPRFTTLEDAIAHLNSER